MDERMAENPTDRAKDKPWDQKSEAERYPDLYDVNDPYAVKKLDDYRLGQLCSIPPQDQRIAAQTEVNRRARERGEPEPFIVDDATGTD